MAWATLQGSPPPWQLHGRDLILFWPGPFRLPGLDQRVSWVLALAIELEKAG